MKANYFLLFIGILGLIFCGYHVISGNETSTSVIGFICGTGLIWGYIKEKKLISNKV
ncbi:hypothetical protein [Tenacibaculum halocynthiae]|uniref:hypothetical protein n=1 Tax=Tenacibaculum halocynthiae TaxID=1254437 RepID=UPI003D659BD3